MSKYIEGFHATDVTYHRNGVGGRPFRSIRFACTLTDFTPNKFMPNMLAVVPFHPSSGHVGVLLESEGVECFVIDLNNPTENWRGENFLSLVLKAIEQKEGKTECDPGCKCGATPI